MRLFLSLASVLIVTVTSAAEPVYMWGKDHRGLQVGARLLSATGKLQVGDPIVLEFVLKNSSDQEQTIVVKQFERTIPTLGANQRIELNVLGSSQRKWQHTLAPDEVLRQRQYRVVISSEGLPAGDYQITARTAFWLSVGPNRGTGVPFNRHIPITIGQPDSVQLSPLPVAEDVRDQIYWGDAVAGVMLGARFPNRKTQYRNGEEAQADLYFFNATTEPIEVVYEIPSSPSAWNLHLQSDDDQFVRLDSGVFGGASPHITRRLTLQPNRPTQITGVETEISVGGETKLQKIAGPSIRFLSDKEAAQPGDAKRLINGSGDYTLHAAITFRRNDVVDLTLVASAAGVPFTLDASVD
ncbi:MAG: hypothetical protein HKN47_11380 [Pirellulaceae bacterium]|nr:hypothetical protein [Pirellulaceae bacterium]